MYADMIRRAEPSPQDVRQLAAVERASLADSPYPPEQMAAVMRRPEHREYLAVKAGEAVGFCSCFYAHINGRTRLEIDMLGVSADHRGRGIGASLIRRAVSDAMAVGVTSSRAVVAEGNTPSLRAFQSAGFGLQTAPSLMLIYVIRGLAPIAYLPPSWSEGTCAAEMRGPSTQTWAQPAFRPFARWLADGQTSSVAKAMALPVFTLSYSGLWVEQVWAATPASLAMVARSLVETAKRESLDEVGYLSPPSEAFDHRQALAAEGFEAAGHYYVLTHGEP